MPKKAREWGALDVKRAAHPGDGANVWHAVGGVAGLLLQITPTGAKSWLLRTTVAGTRRAMGLGSYPEVGLAEARERAREAKRKIAAGVDPIEERKATRAALAAAQRRAMTFAEACDEWAKAKIADRPEKSQRAIRSTLDRYAGPELGGIAVQDVTPQDVVRALAPIWGEKPDTAQKLRGYLEAILSWATVSGYRTGDNPARWGGNLKELLPAPSAIARGRAGNFPAVPVARLADWWEELGQRDGMGAAALRFAALTAARSGEVRGALWSEVDLDAALWVVPGARMKMGREHRVPLSAPAVALLRGLPRLAGTGDLIFPGPRGGMLSDMSVSAVMRRMQEDAETEAKMAGRPVSAAGWRDTRTGRPAVPHGLRSSFRDWAAEVGYDRDMAEIALAHLVGSEVERAYRRSDMLERRRAMMERWADVLAGRSGASVVEFRRA
ncbi:P4 family integrase [Cereibacter sphaeroides WS8N]|uniref:tyrosine-type recombinase/integrase n=1 Tax=Cereibacter sphaeroides TaxID=1063 RepID=UPI00020DF6C2|nr:site-specific integrase [Cereibacter sphaeroides]EGJ21207.1 P4 family integrase [Cereibacter sphaeroides WS8N]